MIRSRWIILFLMLPGVIVQVTAEGFTESHTIELQNGRVLKVNGHLAYVIVSQGNINLTSLETDFAPCQINVDEELSNNWIITSLGNGKIIAWNQKFTDNVAKVAYWKIFIIDPVKCTSTVVKKVPKNSESLNEINTVLPYQDSFDIFSKINECSPCRFKDNGESVDLPKSVYKPLQLLNKYGSGVSTISPLGNNGTDGYLLAESLLNCTTNLKILSPTFEVLREQLIDRYVTLVSTDHDQIRVCSSSLCSGHANMSNECELFDINLKTKKPLERMPEKVTFVQNLPGGGALIGMTSERMCWMSNTGQIYNSYIRQIRHDGQIDSDLKFEITVSCRDYKFECFQMLDGRYCIVTYDHRYPAEVPQAITIKCLKNDE